MNREITRISKLKQLLLICDEPSLVIRKILFRKHKQMDLLLLYYYL